MNKLVDFIIRLFKAFGIVVGSLALFMLVGVGTALLLPFWMAETYAPHDTPHLQFRVIVRAQDVGSGDQVLQLVRWDEYIDLRANGHYEVYRSQTEGACTETPFWCQAENIDTGKQLIELRYGQENFFLFGRYYVVGDQIQPVYCRITDRGHAMMGVMSSFVITPILLVFFLYGVKRYKRRRAGRNLPSSDNGN